MCFSQQESQCSFPSSSMKPISCKCFLHSPREHTNALGLQYLPRAVMNGPLMVCPVAAHTGRFPDNPALFRTPLPFLGATRHDDVPVPFPPAGSAGAGAGATGAGAGAEGN